MKRFTTLILFLLILLCACEGKSEPSDETSFRHNTPSNNESDSTTEDRCVRISRTLEGKRELRRMYRMSRVSDPYIIADYLRSVRFDSIDEMLDFLSLVEGYPILNAMGDESYIIYEYESNGDDVQLHSLRFVCLNGELFEYELTYDLRSSDIERQLAAIRDKLDSPRNEISDSVVTDDGRIKVIYCESQKLNTYGDYRAAELYMLIDGKLAKLYHSYYKSIGFDINAFIDGLRAVPIITEEEKPSS